MKHGLFFLLGAFLLAAGPVAADDASAQDDLRFIEALRSQGKPDLALEYLQRISKTASPELAKQLPLELAKARLAAAGDEPDSGKRLSLYTAAREELQKWLTANPDSPCAGEVKLDMAQVSVMQGRTQLSRALMNPDFAEEMTPDAARARAMLVDAGVQIKEAAKALDAELAKADDKEKKKLANARLQADLNVALNLFDQAQTFPREAKMGQVLAERGTKVTEAQTAFAKVMSKDDTNPICWVAHAWYGRCIHENGDPNKARAEYTVVLNADKRYAEEAQRLARYFRLLAMRETPELPKETPAFIIKTAEDWLRDYPGYLKTPEGYGLRYFLAKVYYQETHEDPKLTPADKVAYLRDARTLLRQVEASENDFTDRARQLKLEVISEQQGGFKAKVDTLKTFEDCYVRAQWELAESSRDEGNPKLTDAQREEKHKEHQAVITAALERGLKIAADNKGRGEEGLELGNAKTMLAFQYLSDKKYREAIAIAEPFAKSDPRSAQGADCAIYTLQCYSGLVGAAEGAGRTPEELQTLRGKLFDFAGYMEKTWPKDAPGDTARFQTALLLVNEKDPDKREENVQKAVETLGRITPGYAQYAVAEYQLAQIAFGADKDKLKPIPGDGPDGYRKRALEALAKIPEPVAGADPIVNKVYFLAKVRLAQEDFTLKKFDDMEQLSTTLLPKLAAVRLDADKAGDDKLRGELVESIKNFRLYARWAKADAEAKANHPDKVAALLDPIVDEIAAGKLPELKNNLPLVRGILDNDLRATIQLNKLDRTPVVLNCYKQLATGDAADAGAAEVLKQLVVFIPPQLEDLKRKKDEAGLKKAQETFGTILEKTIKPLTGDKLTPKLIYFTAQIYSSMDRHKDAADLLDKVPEPAKEAAKTDVDLYQTVRVQYAKERRLNGELEEARKAMTAIMGDPKTGWGRRKVDALVENVELLGAEGKNKDAAEFANALIQKLLGRIDTDPRMKEIYLQCYYLMVENAYRQAQKSKDKAPDKYAKGVKTSAALAVDLAKRQGGFVNDATRGRFRALMDAEPDLKDAFVETYLTALESGAKGADAIKDKGMRDKAVSDVAALIADLEKLWPDYGGDAAKGRVAALLGNGADLKAAYDQMKGAASQ